MLPKLNEVPKYEMTVPSTGEKVRYRPYLVKEEKILMMAYESQETELILSAVVDTIDACLEQGHKVKVDKLTTFDVEYMFTKIRSKSVGEVSKIYIKCKDKDCGNTQEIEVDLDSVELPVNKSASNIVLSEEVIVQMRWPSYQSVINKNLQEMTSNPEEIFDFIAENIETVVYNEERIATKDLPLSEVTGFISSLTKSQFDKLITFFNDIPAMTKKVEFDCGKCGIHNELTLRGMSDFF